MKDQCIGMNITQKLRIKNAATKYRYLIESEFLWVSRLFVLNYSNQDGNSKRYKARRYYLPIGVFKNCNVIINGNKFYDQPIDSDIKEYKEIRKLTIGQGENYTTGFLLDDDYIKNHYRLIAANLSRQKELDADVKAIQQIEFVGQLKDPDDANVDCKR